MLVQLSACTPAVTRGTAASPSAPARQVRRSRHALKAPRPVLPLSQPGPPTNHPRCFAKIRLPGPVSLKQAKARTYVDKLPTTSGLERQAFLSKWQTLSRAGVIHRRLRSAWVLSAMRVGDSPISFASDAFGRLEATGASPAGHCAATAAQNNPEGFDRPPSVLKCASVSRVLELYSNRHNRCAS